MRDWKIYKVVGNRGISDYDGNAVWLTQAITAPSAKVAREAFKAMYPCATGVVVELIWAHQ